MTGQIEIERALKLRQRDIRTKMLADMAVAIAMEDARKQGVDPHRKPLQFAHDVALLATAILIERIYSEDRELAELRALIVEYQGQLERLINTTPPRLIIPIITNPEGER